MIRSIEIKGLRGIQEGKLEDLTSLVVLVGPNGSGKSTVLDALFLAACPKPAHALVRLVRQRRENNLGARWLLWKAGDERAADITVSTDRGNYRNIHLYLAPAEAGGQTVVQSSLTDSNDQTKGQVISLDASVSFGDQGSSGYSDVIKPLDGVTDVTLIDYGTADRPLHNLYSETVRKGRQANANSIISEVISGARDLRLLTEGDQPIIHVVYDNYSVPAALAGDGIYSVLRLSLELASRSDGVVLLEEPEVHQHPGAIRQSARAILAAIRRNIQVILTTHSLELIDALLSEAKDDREREKISIYRLMLQDGCLRSSRLAGSGAALLRSSIEEDLR